MTRIPPPPGFDEISKAEHDLLVAKTRVRNLERSVKSWLLTIALVLCGGVIGYNLPTLGPVVGSALLLLFFFFAFFVVWAKRSERS